MKRTGTRRNDKGTGRAALPLLLAAVLLAASADGRAQRVNFRVGGGLASHYGGGTRSVGALKLGVSYEHELPGNFSIEPGAYFCVKGYKDKDETVFMRDEDGNIVYDDDGNALTGLKNTTTNANYVEIPVLFNYYLEVSSLHYLCFSAGPYAACGVGGRRKVRGDTDKEEGERFFYAKKTFKEEGVRRFDGGVTAGVAYEFSRMFAVGVEADFGVFRFNRGGAKNIAGIMTFTYKLRTGD